jgi:hypothetical protein
MGQVQKEKKADRARKAVGRDEQLRRAGTAKQATAPSVPPTSLVFSLALSSPDTKLSPAFTVSMLLGGSANRQKTPL